MSRELCSCISGADLSIGWGGINKAGRAARPIERDLLSSRLISHDLGLHQWQFIQPATHVYFRMQNRTRIHHAHAYTLASSLLIHNHYS